MVKNPVLSFTIVSTIIVFALSQTACSWKSQSKFPQYIPPSYYTCIETNINNLLAAYFGHANPIPDAETVFKGQVFVFKNIVIDDAMLQSATESYMWVNEIQCYFFQGGSAKRLKTGDKVDIVGVDERVSTEYTERLVFTGCIFLPAGVVQLPIAPPTGLELPIFPSY
jgi:hypothetical protein